MTSFRYLGRVILASDDDWPTVFQNLEKARAVRRRMTRILIREGLETRVSDFLCNAVVQLVLIFGAETWVVTPCMGRIVGGLQDQLA